MPMRLPQRIRAMLDNRRKRTQAEPHPDRPDAPAISRRRTIHGVVLAFTCLALVLALLAVFEHVTGKIGRLFDEAAPAPHASIDVQNALKEVRLPNSINLVEGQGSGAVTLTTATYAFGRRVPGAGSHTKVDVAGTVVLVSPGQAITLRAVRDRDNWRTEAIVDAGRLYVASSTRVTHSDSSDGVGRRVGSVFTEGNIDTRLRTAEEYVNASFHNSCSPPLATVLPAGVDAYVRQLLHSSQQVLAGVKPDAARIIGDLTTQPVTVTFTQNGKTAAADSVTLPQLPVISTETIAERIGAKPADVSVTAAKECLLSPKAAAQLREYAGAHSHNGK